MKIAVRLYGGLRQRSSSNSLDVEISEGAVVADVVEALGLRSGEVWLATLGGQLVEMNQRLQSGDELGLVPPVGGGR